MSGEKRSPIQILQDELNATRRQITNTSRITDNLRDSLNQAQRQRQQDLQTFQQDLQRREQSFQSSIGTLRTGMKDMERHHHAAIQQQSNQFSQQLERQRRETQTQMLKEREERIKRMEQQKREFENQLSSAIGEERKERERAIAKLDIKMDKMKRELQNEILNVEKELNTRIDLEKIERKKEIHSLKQAMENSMEKQRNEYLDITSKQQEELNEIRNDITQIFAKEKGNRDFATNFIKDLEQQIAEAERSLPHQKFVPGKIETLKRDLTLIKSSLPNAEQAAIAGAQRAYLDLVKLREEIYQKEHEFNLWHSVTLEAARALFESIRSNRNIEMQDDAGTLEADFWTNGQFSALENELQSLVIRLEKEQASLSLEEIKQFMEVIKTKELQMDALIKEAIERAISSQIRAEIGDRVVDSLENEGFTLLSSGYEEEDARRIYLVKLANRAGTEIVASIVPDDKANTNILSVNTRDEKVLNEAATVARFEGIRRVLGEAGLQLGNTECKSKHIDELYDVENIIKKGGGGIPKSVLEKARMINSQTKK